MLLAEYAPAKRRGFIASFVSIGTNTGTLLASGIWLALSLMPEEALLSWGWRIPFVASVLVAIVALIIRRKLDETPVFIATAKVADTEERTPFRDILTTSRRPFLIAMGLRIGESGPSSLFQSFLLGYIATVLLMDRSIGAQAVFIASIIGFATVPLAGWLSDRFGRRIVYRLISGFQTLWIFPTFLLLNSREPALMTLAIVVGVAVGVLGLYSVQSSYLPELFGSNNRYTGLAVAKEFGSIISGGIAPLVAAALLGWFSSSWIPIAIYGVVMAGIAFATTFVAPETRGRDLTLVEDATK